MKSAIITIGSLMIALGFTQMSLAAPAPRVVCSLSNESTRAEQLNSDSIVGHQRFSIPLSRLYPGNKCARTIELNFRGSQIDHFVLSTEEFALGRTVGSVSTASATKCIYSRTYIKNAKVGVEQVYCVIPPQR